MTKRRSTYVLAATAILAVAGATSPLRAQPDSWAPEASIEASLQVDSGLAFARAQIADRDLLGAAGTLERVTLSFPDAVPPRLLYASLLCRLDDRQGAEVELALLAGYALPDDGWAEVTAACGAIDRPAPRRGKGR